MVLFESSSSWILALGKTLLHSIWAGLFVFSAVRLILQWIGKDKPVARYRLAFASQILFAAGMFFTFMALYSPLQGIESGAVQVRFPYPVRITHATGPGRIRIFYYYITLLYLTGVIVSVVSTITGVSRIRRIRRDALPVNGIWMERLRKLALQAGIRRNVVLLSSSQVRIPFLTGILKPVIIVPAGLFTLLPFAQVEVILLHELHHLKRRDHIAVIVQRILSILFFYHPAIYALAAIAEREREHCCDDHVVDQRGEPMEYARALCRLADRMNRVGYEPVSAATGIRRGHLKHRIQRILNQETMKTNMKERFSAIALFTLSLAVVLIISGFSAGLSITRYKQLPVTEAVSPGDSDSTPDEPAPPAVSVPVSPATMVAELSAVMPALPETAPLPRIPEIPSDPGFGTLPRPDSVAPDAEVINKQVEEAKKALEEIDWDSIHKEIEQARENAMDEIDWEAIHSQMEEARKSMEEIDWDSIHKEIEQAREKAMDEIDWEAIHSQMEEARKSMKEIDWEEMHREMSKAWEQVDWEEIYKALEGVHIDMDSLMQNFHFEHDFKFDFDFGDEKDHEADVENDLDI